MPKAHQLRLPILGVKYLAYSSSHGWVIPLTFVDLNKTNSGNEIYSRSLSQHLSPNLRIEKK